MADLTLLKEAMQEMNAYFSSLQDLPLKTLYINVLTDFQTYAVSHDCDLKQSIRLYYKEITFEESFERPQTKLLRHKARILLMVNDIISGRPPQRKYCYSKTDVPEEFINDVAVYSLWMQSQNKSDGTVYTRCGRLKVFLIFLHNNGCKGIENITLDLNLLFINSLSDRYTAQGRANILYTLRDFFSCPVITSRLSCNPLLLIRNIHSKKHERLASCYTTGEIQKIMSSVDRSKKTGKTDYLMMILACVYGIRVSDIRELRLSYIKWKKKFIQLYQYKTKRFVKFPLTDNVMLALLDYIKNVRPESDDDHVFIKQRSPHEPYSEHDHFAYRISHYFSLAEINIVNKHHGLHSLRHSLATELIAENYPINEVATIMGHTTVASTGTYVWSDIKHLKIAALEVSAYDR